LLRDLTAADGGALEQFVLMAAFVPERPPPRAAHEMPHVRRWLDGWPSDGDVGVGWDEDGVLVGAAWARVVEPVRLRDDDGRPLPELIVAVERGARGREIGRALLEGLADRARRRAWPGLTLTVSDRNPAARLYRQLGYEQSGRTARASWSCASCSPDPLLLHPRLSISSASGRRTQRSGGDGPG
jgi:GNAT superfamily N-acetyltransferase